MRHVFNKLSPLIFKVILLLLIFNLFNLFLIFSFLKKDLAKINFLNVGQGDSALIISSSGNILVDAGPNNKVVEQLKKIMPFYDPYIDIVIISHPNTDHFLGLFDVLKNYKIRAVVLNNITYSSEKYSKLLNELKKSKVPLIKGIQGVKISLDHNQKINILFPEKLNGTPLNENSLVLSYINPLAQFLFLGDISSKEEEKISKYLNSFNYLYRVLKVAHHGSKNATSENLLKVFQPNFAVIEVGKNSYSHPHFSVLERLEKFGVKTFRTDQDGLIQFSFDKNFSFWYKLIK
ncbi:MAG: ComEC/Rec2 family competence protein [Candidatus Paceibacterota bacterium]